MRRRVVVGLLVLVSLVLITVYFRESPNGSLHSFQSAGSSVLRPFEIAADRIARPFQDAYNWTADVFHAKNENKQLREDVKKLRQQAIQNSAAAGNRATNANRTRKPPSAEVTSLDALLVWVGMSNPPIIRCLM